MNPSSASHSSRAADIAANLPHAEAISALWAAFSSIAEHNHHLWWLRFEVALEILNSSYEAGPPLDLDRWDQLLRLPDEQAAPKPQSNRSSSLPTTSSLRKAA